MVKYPIGNLPSMDKIAQDGFYFHFFEKPHNKVKMLNLHG